MSIVGGTPGSTRMSNSLKRNCDILVSGGMEVILKNLGLSGDGLGLPCVGGPGTARSGDSPKRDCNTLKETVIFWSVEG